MVFRRSRFRLLEARPLSEQGGSSYSACSSSIGLVQRRRSGNEAQLPRHDESRSEEPALDHRAVGAHVYRHPERGRAGFWRGGAPRPRTGVRRLVRSLAEGRGGASRRSSEVVRDGRKPLDDGGKLSAAGPAEEVLPGEQLCIITGSWG